ncbi:MAG: hypothetical protein RIM23_30305 [Coleofasciculus sp. G3-WIS-01]|uniref:hypothetical protein n=1 Tax=Coleofasciculus sp. G3-WIS-01 TaxID=3069528 RepID=UPI0032F6B71E
MTSTSLTEPAIATLVLTNAVEKTGEQMQGQLIEQRHQLWHLLQDRFPTTATEIELTEQQPLNGNQAARIAKHLEEVAKTDSEVAKSVQSIADTVQSQPKSLDKFTQIAQEIKMEVQGAIANRTNLDLS